MNSRMKPRIGMLIRIKLGDYHYVIGQRDVDSIKAAGGFPIMIPVTESLDDIDTYTDSIDGLYIPGGPDINALLFGEEPIPGMGRSRRSDDLFEMEIIRNAASKKLPMLGVCRGEQVINTAFGGTLYQDISAQCPNALRHYQPDSGTELTHSVKIAKDSVLCNAICHGERIEVNSYHHQAVKNLGHGLKASGFSADGLIEAIESEDGLIIGVQWHPEMLREKHEVHAALFNYLIECAKN